jgi:hypothetical protein
VGLHWTRETRSTTWLLGKKNREECDPEAAEGTDAELEDNDDGEYGPDGVTRDVSGLAEEHEERGEGERRGHLGREHRFARVLARERPHLGGRGAHRLSQPLAEPLRLRRLPPHLLSAGSGSGTGGDAPVERERDQRLPHPAPVLRRPQRAQQRQARRRRPHRAAW